MTLILSELSQHGIAMAADSAVTFQGTGRSYYGAQKLLPVPQIRAGFSIWGAGSVNGIDSDLWVQQFISCHVNENMKLSEVATLLANELNQAFGRIIETRMGVHVAGFEQRGNIRGPALYQVHNGHAHVKWIDGEAQWIPDEDPPIREFRAHADQPPASLHTWTSPKLWRNGDIAIFYLIFDNIRPIFQCIEQSTQVTFPYPDTLLTRGEYLRFWINTTAEIYRLSNVRLRILPQWVTAGETSIGGPVSVLTISENGICSFYTR